MHPNGEANNGQQHRDYEQIGQVVHTLRLCTNGATVRRSLGCRWFLAGTGGPNLENASYAIGAPWKITTQANKMHPLQLYCVNGDE